MSCAPPRGRWLPAHSTHLFAPSLISACHHEPPFVAHLHRDMLVIYARRHDLRYILCHPYLLMFTDAAYEAPARAYYVYHLLARA